MTTTQQHVYRVLVVDDMEEVHDVIEDIVELVNKFKGKEENHAINAILDDNHTIDPSLKQEIGKKIPSLKNYTFEINHAYSGEEAIEKVLESSEKNDPFAIVFMDVRMEPGIDGVIAAQQVLKITRSTQIVLLTAYSKYTWNDLLEIFGPNPRFFILKKPFDMHVLIQTMVTLCVKWKQEQKMGKDHEELFVQLNAIKNTAYPSLPREQQQLLDTCFDILKRLKRHPNI